MATSIYRQMAVAALFASLFTLLIWGIKQYNNETENDDDKQRAIKYRDLEQGGGFNIIVLIVFILFFGLFFVAIYFGMKAQTQRYNLASEAIKKGNKNLAMAALAPEIGAGIGNVEQGLGNIFWGGGRMNNRQVQPNNFNW